MKVPINFSAPIRADHSNTKISYIGPQQMRDGKKIDDPYVHLVLVGPTRDPVYVDADGFALVAGKRKQMIWQQVETAAKPQRAEGALETAMLLLTEEVTGLREDIKALVQVIAARPAQVELGKPSAALAPDASAATVRSIRSSVGAAPEKIEHPDRIPSELLLEQLGVLAGYGFVKKIYPGTVNANGVAPTGMIRPFNDSQHGVICRGALDPGSGILDLHVYCETKDRGEVKRAIEDVNALLEPRRKLR